MITPRPSKGTLNESDDGIESHLWRGVLAIANTYEEAWYQDRSIDPVAFAKRHPDIPFDILSQELIRLRDELATYHLDSVPSSQTAHRFSIIKTLRSGGIGVVYLAYDHDCNRQVAIKKIRPEFRNDPLVISRFHAEAELTAGLEHPGIIPIYARGEIDKAIADQLKALEFIDSQQPETFTAAMASAQAHYGMAILHIQSQKPEQAIEQFDLTSDALVLAEKLSSQALPLEFLVYRSQLAYNRSNLLFSQNQPLRAIEILKHQLQGDTQAVSDFQPNQIVLEAYHRNANFLHALYIQSGRQSEVPLCWSSRAANKS